MWIVTTDGFFSIVRKGEPGALCVRARSREHLERFRDRFAEGEAGEILEEAGTDYRCRFFASEAAFRDALSRVPIDYSNFKDHCARRKFSERYLRALHEIWHAMHRALG